MAVYKKPGIQKARVAQRKLHAVIAKKPEPVSNWFSRILAGLFGWLNRIRGRG